MPISEVTPLGWLHTAACMVALLVGAIQLGSRKGTAGAVDYILKPVSAERFIVQLSAIEGVRRNELGKLEISLRNCGEVIPVSQSFNRRFRGM